MSANKKQKLNYPETAPQLSAFAARRAFKGSRTAETPIQDVQVLEKRITRLPKSPSKNGATNQGPQRVSASTQTPEFGVGNEPGIDGPDEDEAEESSSQSRAESPEVLLERPLICLSNFKPSKVNLKELEDGSISLKLAPGERLILLGEFDISVQKGEATLLGVILQPSKTLHRVCAPSSHSLPVIRCLATEVDHAEIRLHQCGSGLRQLSSLSPLFSKMWNDSSSSLGLEHKSLARSKKRSSFQILLTSKDGPQKSYLQPLISPPEWNQLLSKFSTSSDKIRTIMICGPKSSGKSTFAHLLTNRLLSVETEKSNSSKVSQPGVALLDLDPGQPEYSIPGQLSLVHIQEPNFSPPFAHPIPGPKSRVVRAHTIASITPAQDTDLYMACAIDLFAHYRNLLSTTPNCPLVINTSGWVLGTGLELLTDLIAKIHPTDIIYMSQEGPWDVVKSLKEAAKSTPVYTLPSQTSEYTTRTAAHLRTMQTMSYFHLDPKSKDNLVWNDTPLTAIPPWEIKYSGESAGILGIICYGEQPPADLLFDSINGSLVAVVVIDDMAAIPGWNSDEPDTMHDNSDPIPSPGVQNDTQTLQNPLLIRTPISDLPYFNPFNSISLLPQHSHCVGMALVRGIDIPRRRLQVLTPISPGIIEEASEQGKNIVLVSGKFDTPGWAYTEDMVKTSVLEKEGKKQGDEEGSDEEMDGDENVTEVGKEHSFTNVPWVERLEGSQGRGVGARVWRVRRDLGKSDSGD